MPEIGSSGLMSGDGKRGVGHRPQATAPILDSTSFGNRVAEGNAQHDMACASRIRLAQNYAMRTVPITFMAQNFDYSMGMRLDAGCE